MSRQWLWNVHLATSGPASLAIRNLLSCRAHPLRGIAVRLSMPPGLPPLFPTCLRHVSRPGFFAHAVASSCFVQACAVPAMTVRLTSRRNFAGQRDAVLARDGRRCQACGSNSKLAVHHRRQGVHQPRHLITLCAACHARVHRLGAVIHWLDPALVALWHEQHPRTALQLQFDW